MVTIRMLASGCPCLIIRVAASPSILGIRTSIKTRSGCKREHISTASRPSSASPTTSKPSSRANMPRKPCRTRPWSSAMTIRTGVVRRRGCFSPFVITRSFRVGLLSQRNLHYHHRADSWFALDLEVTLEHGDPLAHAGEADLLTWVGSVRSVVRHEPQPPVADLEANLLRPALKRDVRPVRSRVPAYVRERLLSNSKERRLYNFWQAFFSQRFLVACPKTLTGKPLHLQAERSPQPEVVKHRGSQVGDHVAGFLDRVLWHLQRFIELIFAAGE